jgi:hypothetical protein
VLAREIARGAERDRVLDEQPKPQPPPMRFMYRRARRHLDAVERIFRLDLDDQSGADAPERPAMATADASGTG